MIARLSSTSGQSSALGALNTRSGDDFSVALLDAWAVVCDVLTFYQERIANESYARTSTEHASLLQLARSVSYQLRPGVAADSYLAFTVEDAPGAPGKALIDIGTKVQSLPNPGEKPQMFETVEGIEASSMWNAIRPRKTRSQLLSTDMPVIVFKGASTNLKAGDMLLIIAPNSDDKQPPDKVMRRVRRVAVDTAPQQTTAYLEDVVLRDQPPSGDGAVKEQQQPLSMPPVLASPPSPPGNGAPVRENGGVKVAASSRSAPQTSLTAFGSLNGNAYQPLNNTTADTLVHTQARNPRDLNAFATLQGWSVKDVLANVAVQSQISAVQAVAATTEDVTGVYVLRSEAALFGHNAPDWQSMPDSIRKVYYNKYEAMNPTDSSSLTDFTDWPFIPTVPAIVVPASTTPPTQTESMLDLDRTYPQFLNKSWVAVMRPDNTPIIAQIDSTTETSVVNYTLTGRVTRLKLHTTENASAKSMEDIRQISVYGQSEKLVLDDLPIEEPVQGNTINALGLYDGLAPGRTLMVSGELANLDGVQATEVAILKDISYDADFPSGLTVIKLENPLSNAYKPETVTVYGNIARATQGETVQDEILGDGDSSQTYQSFTLRQAPLTYVHDDTPSGIVSTLKVYVNGIQWQEVPTFVSQGPRDHVFITRTTDDGKTVVQFGDGQTGARLPDGQENVHATYRKGSGSSGQVNAAQLTQLMTRPLGVKSVTNPLAPEGAEDPESNDEARNNASLTVLTLSRIVSVPDYENLARSFVGVAKAQASAISSGNGRSVVVTLAGTDGNEIVADDPLYKKVFYAMQAVSDPSLPLTLLSYRKALFRLDAKIRVEPDFAQSDVLTAVQQTVRTYFSFDLRSLGQSVARKEVTTVIQDVPGVVMAIVGNLYRVGDPPEANAELYAAESMVSQDDIVLPAELLMADTIPFDALEVLP